VIIYQANSPSLVRARSQEELEVVFAVSLWLTGLTGEGHQSDWCHLLSNAVSLTGPIGDAWQFKFSGTKSLSRTSRLFTPL
jgi:hypothetical protein